MSNKENIVRDVTQEAERYHEQLSAEMKSWLRNGRGLSDAVIFCFKLGSNGKALTIPISNKEGRYTFFKFRKDPNDNSDKDKYWYSKGSSAELYGWEHITEPKSSLVICEGELDRLILESYDIPAITATSGAATFKEEWIDIINKIPSEIVICYDNDDAGMNGAEKIANRIPRAKIVQIPKSDGIKDITEFIMANGIEKFKELLAQANTLEDIKSETKVYDVVLRRAVFPPYSIEELTEVLGLTIKEDAENKVITFLCQLSAYTGDSQFNISFNAPSSTGKSYIPIEIQSLFPEEDVTVIGYCSPTAFFHDIGKHDKNAGAITIDFRHKILIFLDQPHTFLLQHLRPILSHDVNKTSIKITDRNKGSGLRTKNVVIEGFPAVIFCTAGLKIDEQEATRFLLLSPDITQEKIRKSIFEAARKKADSKAYGLELENNPQRQALKDRIRAIREENIEDIKILATDKITDAFTKRTVLKARSSRDIGRVISFVKAFALLNVWYRDREGSVITANDEDIDQAVGNHRNGTDYNHSGSLGKN